MTPACRAEYERAGGRQHGDRIIRCHLPTGHPGEHEEADTEITWQPLLAPAAPHRPPITVLCGSTRFKDAHEAINRQLTLEGHIVLACGVYGHADGVLLTDDQKTALDELHLAKIRLADQVYVINPGQYVGNSTRREIAYATDLGKPIRYLVDEIDARLREFIDIARYGTYPYANTHLRITTAMLAELRALCGLPPEDGPPPGPRVIDHFMGISIVVDEELAEGTWRLVDNSTGNEVRAGHLGPSTGSGDAA